MRLMMVVRSQEMMYVCIYLIYMAHAAVWAEAGIGHLDPPEAYRSKFRACYLQLHVPHMIG